MREQRTEGAVSPQRHGTPEVPAATKTPGPDAPTTAPVDPEADFRADSTQMAADLEAIARIGGTAAGVTRPGYSELEREAHQLVSRWLEELGCRVWTDAAGNTVAELPGAEPRPALGTGSHLDSVPGGGRFDGVAGVVAAIEAVRILRRHGVALRRPVRVVCFAAEEGARFGQACLGSRAAAGVAGPDPDELRDAGGTSRAEAMRRLGLDPGAIEQARWDPREWAAFVEVHVEQGTVLEAQAVRLGIVDLVSGSSRVAIELIGRASHSGGTPMPGRADALAAAAEVVLAAEALATDPRHRGTRATVGRLMVAPGHITTIPGKVTFTLDVRDVDSERQRSTTLEILRRAATVCARRKVEMHVRAIGDTSPTVLPIWIRRVLAATAREAGVEYRVLSSGASHDSQVINAVVPAGILFVPSRFGLSHVAEEWTDLADLAVGAEVLARGLIRLDQELVAIEAAR